MRQSTGGGRSGRAQKALGGALSLWLLAGAGHAQAQQPAQPGAASLIRRVADPALRSDARPVVRNLSLSCFDDSHLQPDVILSTVGVESQEGGATRFQPVLSLAFDRDVRGGDGLEWMALWNLGKQPTGFWSNLRALVPLNRHPRSVEWRPPTGKLRLLERLESGESEGPFPDAPDPEVDAARLGHPSYAGLATSTLRQALDRASVFNPVQFVYRTWLFRRRDLRDRRFQQTYQALGWYLDAVERSGLEVPHPTLAEVGFHLIRNRSTYAPWVAEAQYFDWTSSYDSAWRQRNNSVSATLLMAANEVGLGFQELREPVESGASRPVGGFLYFDPAVAPRADQVRWPSPNLFDLKYNPFTDRRVQELAAQHPGERIPLALYSYYAVLPRKPILLVDFFDADNAAQREAAAVRMSLFRELLQTGGPGLVYWGLYRPTVYIANKKAFTWLANRVPAMGVEEFRLLLRSGLLFEPELAGALLREVDKRELNPLMPVGPAEQLNARLNYKLLQANHGAAVCQQVREVRQQLLEAFTGATTPNLTPETRAALRGWLDQRRALLGLARLSETPMTWEQLKDESAPVLAVLETVSLSPRLPTRRLLLQFYARLFDEEQRLPGPLPAELADTTAQVERLLARAARAEGRSTEQVARDLHAVQNKILAEQHHEQARLAKKQRDQFKNELAEALDWLDKFRSKGDLLRTSPWRVERAVEFLTQAPALVRQNQRLEPVLARYRSRIEKRLAQTQVLLTRASYQNEIAEGARRRCLELLAASQRAPLPAVSGARSGRPAGSGGGQ